MTMGEKIKYYRKQLGLSQEELGQKMSPPVFKSAVSKWEKGRVENIKRSQIKQLSDLFGITPIELLSFDVSDSLFDAFNKLNAEGQEKLLAYADDLVSMSKYIRSDL